MIWEFIMGSVWLLVKIVVTLTILYIFKISWLLIYWVMAISLFVMVVLGHFGIGMWVF